MRTPPAASTMNDIDEALPGLTLGGKVTVIVLMGKTGSGKSSLIKLLGGKDHRGCGPTVDGGVDSCTFNTAVYQTTFNNKKILLLDTPGFDDSARDNLKVLNEIVSNLYYFALQRAEIEIRGVIYLHDISEVRYSGSQRKTWEILQAFVGPEAIRHVHVGLTMWSPETSRKFQNETRRESDLASRHWLGIGGTIRLPEGDLAAVNRLITDILRARPVLLRVQQEMLRPPHTVENTTAGGIAMPEGRAERERLEREYAEAKKRHAEDMQRHREEFERREKEAKERAEREREEQEKRMKEEKEAREKERKGWEEAERKREEDRKRQEQERQQRDEAQRRAFEAEMGRMKAATAEAQAEAKRQQAERERGEEQQRERDKRREREEERFQRAFREQREAEEARYTKAREEDEARRKREDEDRQRRFAEEQQRMRGDAEAERDRLHQELGDLKTAMNNIQKPPKLNFLQKAVKTLFGWFSW